MVTILFTNITAVWRYIAKNETNISMNNLGVVASDSKVASFFFTEILDFKIP
jgi:hypothetical protein